MKFTTVQTDFAEAVASVLPAIPMKSTQPVLEFITFELSNSKLTLTATNQEITLRTSIIVKSDEDGELLVPARKLYEILKSLAGESTIEFKENNKQITLTTKNGKYSMLGLDILEMLELPFDLDKRLKNDAPIKLTSIEVQSMFNAVAYAVGNDEFRPAMCGVNFKASLDKCITAGTDSFRLGQAVIPADNVQGRVFTANGFTTTLPIRAVNILKKANSNVYITPIYDEQKKISFMHFWIGDLICVTRVIAEPYPPYEQIIPRENNRIVKIDRVLLLDSVRRLSIFASSISHQMKMNVHNNVMTLTANDDSSQTNGKEELPCEFAEEEKFVCGFNLNYMIDTLSHLEENPNDTGDYAYLQFKEPEKPVLINTDINSQYRLHLLMPVKLSKEDLE